MSPTFQLSRRSVLKASGFGVLALTLPLPAEAMAAAPTPPVYRRASWLPLVGRSLPVAAGPELELTAVADLSRAASDAALRDLDEAFVLTFAGPGSPELASGIHQLEHPELGSVSLFVTPVGDGKSKQRYEAVVDRTIRLASALDAPAVEGGAADAVAAAAASSFSVAPAIGVKPAAAALRRRLRVNARASRAGSKVVLDLTFPGGGLQAVSVALHKGGKTVAKGQGAVRHGKATLPLRSRRHLARGSYELVVTATDRAGQPVTVTRSVSIR